MVEPPHRLWQRALGTLSALATFVVVVAALFWARSVLVPIALAILFMFVLSPLVRLLRRTGLGRVPAILITVALTAAVAGTVLTAVVWQFGELTNELPANSERIKAKLASARAAVSGDGDNRFTRMFDEIAAVFAPKPRPDDGIPTVRVQEDDSYSSWLKQAPAFLSPASEVLGQLLFALVLSVFMLFKQDDLRNRMIRLIGDSRLTTATKAADDASRRISRYLVMQLLINTVFGAIVTAVMFLVGVPYAFLWGFMASMMRYIPYLGTWLGLVPAVVVTLAFMDGWTAITVVVAVYASLELLCNNFVEPRAYGASMGLSEVAQLVAAAFWAFLWGPVGLILSGPLTVCLLVVGKYVPRLQFLETLLGDEPVLGPDVQFYQRLAAGDHDGAYELLLAEQARLTLPAAYESVAVPALCYAKRDANEMGLSPADMEKILDIAGETIEEVSEKDAEQAAAASSGASPARPRIRILAIPARDRVDELAMRMLKSCLDANAWEVEVPTAAKLTSEIVVRMSEFDPAVIVIGSLPPEGIAHTRYISKRIVRQFPSARIVVGRWHSTLETAEQKKPLAELPGVAVAESLAQTLIHLQSWLAALEAGVQQSEKSPEPARIGTAGAIPVLA
jgi:predicted PurR-regulated permease PerM